MAASLKDALRLVQALDVLRGFRDRSVAASLKGALPSSSPSPCFCFRDRSVAASLKL